MARKTVSLPVRNMIIFAIILLVIGLIVGYIIFARERVTGKFIPLAALLGLKQDFWRNFGNSLREGYLDQVRIKIIVSGLIGMITGFVLGFFSKKIIK